MAEIRETYVVKEREFGKFGGRVGSRATFWLAVIVSASLIASGAIYLLPLFW